MQRCEGGCERSGKKHGRGGLILRMSPSLWGCARTICGDERVSLFRSPAVALVETNLVVVFKDGIDNRPGRLNRVFTGK